MLVNFKELLKDKYVDYYNGGWAKEIKSVNLDKKDGYCFIGDFVKKDLLMDVNSGLYLVCDIKGTRKSHVKNYYFFWLNNDGTHDIILELLDAKEDWALHARDKIYDFLLNKDERKILIERKERLEKELEEINERLMRL